MSGRRENSQKINESHFSNVLVLPYLFQIIRLTPFVRVSFFFCEELQKTVTFVSVCLKTNAYGCEYLLVFQGHFLFF